MCPNTAEGKDASDTLVKSGTRIPRMSSGVLFHPHSRYWRIAGKWYDLEPFLNAHPGGRDLLLMARDRFDDCTFAFEAHHHNYQRARDMLDRFEVPKDIVGTPSPPVTDDPSQKQEPLPLHLAAEDSFYSTLRRRVAAVLKERGGSGPTQECWVVYFSVLATWAALFVLMAATGSIIVAALLGIAAGWLGAFGHNWVHQPKHRWWAYMALDIIGLSSENWFREHVLQHHMFTNTPKDNHFRGTEPFLMTNPTCERSWLQTHILPFINPLVLSFAVWGNYTIHCIHCAKGEEKLQGWKLCLPVEVGMMLYLHGPYGLLLMYVYLGVLGVYYFTIALLNHNVAHTMDVKERNGSSDWGLAQLNSSADWGVGLSFKQAMGFLWLNYHTVHHLFPHVDFCHHPAIQSVLLQLCRERGVHYVAGPSSTFTTLYKEMLVSFATPRSLMAQVSVYSGGV